MSEVDNLRKEIKNLVCERFVAYYPLHGDFSKTVLAVLVTTLLGRVEECGDVAELQEIKRRLTIAGSTSPSSFLALSYHQT